MGDKVKSGWSDQRNARLGFLIGCRRAARDIAVEMGLSENAVYVQAQRLNLRFREVPNSITVDVSATALVTLLNAARARMTTPEGLLARVTEIFAAEPHLLGNVLDD